MAYHHTTVVDNQIKALPTVDTASGAIATFETDLTENLVSVKCQIVASQSGSGTPSPSNPRPITTYTSLNLSHSGADTSNPTVYNIPFGQTVANGVLDVTTGKLRVTWGIVDLGSLTWTKSAGFFYANLAHKKASSASVAFNAICSEYPIVSQSVWASNDKSVWDYTTSNDKLICVVDSTYNNSTASDFKTAMNGVQLVYELASPIEIQLDSITLQALLNENNVWCDTGDTEVKYLLTVGKKIS